MENSKIEWTHHTFNPWWGCAKVSPGCEHCYAETFSNRYGHNIWGPAKTTDRRLFGDKHWNEPLKWNRKAKEVGERHRVFCASMADVFEAHPQVVNERAKLFGLIQTTPNLIWLLLTKRPENIMPMIDLWSRQSGLSAAEWLRRMGDRVWIGTSVEDQKRADERIPHLLKVPAKIRFLSAEPLLGPININGYLQHGWIIDTVSAYGGTYERALPQIHWVIVGGESGHGARPMEMAWVESLIKQCRAAHIAIHVKQLGSIWGKEHFADSKGGYWLQWPEHLRIREYPQVFA